MNVCFVGSYPPRECGIATFTHDTRLAVMHADPAGHTAVIAVNDPGSNYAYPWEVQWQIDRDDPPSYHRAAEFANRAGFDVINLQHEYGLFGGEWGSMLFRFLDGLQAPVVLTLHTVLPRPDQALRDVTRQLVRRASRTIVLARSAIDILEHSYDIDRRNLCFVPHGVPDVSVESQATAKRALGFGERTVLMTCGLMNRGKGLEYAIEAIAGLVDRFPDVLYVIAGETHPGVRANEGESYREELHALVRTLHLEQHVRFEDCYLSYGDLVLHLLASDVYLVPYLNLDQIVSGTLAYALGCGRVVVSTPSIYAREVLAGGRGLLAAERDPGAIRSAAAAILEDQSLKHDIERRAYDFGRRMIWPRVAQGYLRAFHEAVRAQPPRISVPVEYGLQPVVVEVSVA